jgi:signal transduction histidine kinase/ActR/RegA family two-component response regulator
MNIYSFLPLLSSGIILFIFAYIIGQRRHDRINRALYLVLANLLVLTLIELFLRIQAAPSLDDIFMRIGGILCIVSGTLFVNFMYALVGKQRDMRIGLSAMLAVLFAAASLFPALHMSGPCDLGETTIIVPQLFFLIAMIATGFVPGVYALRLCQMYRRTSSDRRIKKQLSLMLAGVFLSVIFVISFGTIIPAVFRSPQLGQLTSLGVVIFVVTIFRAVSKYKFLSYDLEQIQTVSGLLFANMRDAVIIMDEQGACIDMNDAARALFKSGPDTVNRGAISAAIKDYDPHSTYEEARKLFSNGITTRTVLLTQVPIKESDASQGRILFIRDITEHVKTEEALAHARQIESLGMLAGGIAHDFNNFLTGIAASFSLLKARGGADPESLAVLDEGEKATRNATSLTHQLLTFARGGAPVRQPLDIIAEIEKTMRFALRGSGVSYTITQEPKLIPAHADPGQIGQALHNLALNAIQAMSFRGAITIACRNRELADREAPGLNPGRYIEIRFSDSGRGMSPEVAARIFEPYFTTKSGGTGLGLTTVYSIVKRHGGHISVETKPEAGTTFMLLLPAFTGSVTPPPAGKARKRFSGTVLVMDDDPVVRTLLKKLLELLGFSVDAAPGGQEALALYHDRTAAGAKYAAVIADLTVEQGNIGGQELARRLLALDPSIKTIVSSGYSNDPIMANFREHGFCGVLKKPYQLKELEAVIADAVGAAES